jgi:hypothetical protein
MKLVGIVRLSDLDRGAMDAGVSIDINPEAL